MEAGIFQPTVEPKATVTFIEELWPEIFAHDIVLSRLSYHPGSVRFDEMVFLAAIVKHLQPKRIFEFGTCKGRTTVNLAANADNLEALYTLNLEEATDANADMTWVAQDYLLHQQARGQIGALFANCQKNIVQLWGDSLKFDYSRFAGMDLVFIDASKHYDYVWSDSVNAFRMLGEKGLIVWHDYNYADGVTRAVDDFACTQKVPVYNIHKTTLGLYIK